VFIASPSDVTPERELVERAVREINLNLRASGNDVIQLEVVRWETHAYPDFGRDPQSVINAQLGMEYDIFLGIFWSRIGTPTGRYASGTVEEFELAYDKWQKAKESVTLMIYFKEAALSPHELDTDQLAQIQRLRSRLPSSGGLYWTFKTVDEFETTVRLHLTRVVQDWRPRLAKAGLGRIQGAPISASDAPDADELGLIDYLELMNDASNRHQAALTKMTNALTGFGKQVQALGVEVEMAMQQKHLPSIRLICQKSAESFNALAAIIRAETPNLSEAHSDLLRYQVSCAASLLEFGESGNPQVRLVLEQLDTFCQANETAHSHIKALRLSFTNIPPLTAVLNKARRRAQEAIDRVETTFAEMVQTNSRVRGEISELLAFGEAAPLR
jgi:hypothetical protein